VRSFTLTHHPAISSQSPAPSLRSLRISYGFVRAVYTQVTGGQAEHRQPTSRGANRPGRPGVDIPQARTGRGTSLMWLRGDTSPRSGVAVRRWATLRRRATARGSAPGVYNLDDPALQPAALTGQPHRWTRSQGLGRSPRWASGQPPLHYHGCGAECGDGPGTVFAHQPTCGYAGLQTVDLSTIRVR
jgi:hypothetical protein